MRIAGAATRGVAGVGRGMGEHSDEQCSTVIVLTNFYRTLTDRNSKFHIGTCNLVKIEVIEEEKIYNFCFGRKLI